MPFAATGYTAICVVVGIAMIGFSIYQRNRMRVSESWPQAMGKILKAEVVDMRSQDSAEYIVQVQYEYAVNGVSYTGQRIGFNRRSFVRKKSAEAELVNYPVNTSVIVFFNPEKPDDAVLVRTAPHNILYLVMGSLLLGLAVFIVLHYALR